MARQIPSKPVISLRNYRESDLDRLVEMANNENVSRYLADAFPFPYTPDDGRWWLNEGTKSGVVKAIEYDGLMVGGIGAHPRGGVHRKQATVGYWIAEPYWGKGIATEALRLLCAELFASTELNKLHAWVFSANPASMKVLKNAGFHQEAVLKDSLFKHGQFYDEHIFVRFRDGGGT